MIHLVLRMLRLNNKLTQRQVAEFLEVDRSTYTYYETGKIKPDTKTLTKLCCIFNVSLEVLSEITSGSMEGYLEEYLTGGEDLQNFDNLNSREKRLLMLFRLSREKDEAFKLLEEQVLGSGFSAESGEEEDE